MRSAGLSDIEGSCGTYETTQPRSLRSSCGVQLQDVPALDDDLAARDDRAAALVHEQRRGGRRLAGGRLADEAEHLAAADRELDLVVDVGAGRLELDAQALDGEDDVAHSTPVLRSMPMIARARPSAIEAHGDRQQGDHERRARPRRRAG